MSKKDYYEDELSMEVAECEAEISDFLSATEIAELQEREDELPDELKGDDAWVEFGAKCNSTRIVPKCSFISTHKAGISKAKAISDSIEAEKATIRRKAYEQNVIDLSDTVSESTIKKLIEIVTEKETKAMDRLANLINRHITAMLKYVFPKPLMSCYRCYPNSFIKCAGFYYVTSEETGSIQYWATPDLPYYISQGEELNILKHCSEHDLKVLDNTVRNYKVLEDKRSRKEYRVAAKLVRANDKKVTYKELLEINPIWFNVIYKLRSNESK